MRPAPKLYEPLTPAVAATSGAASSGASNIAHVTVMRQIDPMERNRNIEIDSGRPKRIIVAVVKRPAFHLVVGQDQGDRAKFFNCAARFDYGQLDVV